MLPFKTIIKIEPHSKQAIYEQIALALTDLIKTGKLLAGARLPSSRSMATMLQVHRKTVVAAYEILILQGWVGSKNKSGYFIHPDIAIPKRPPMDRDKVGASFIGEFPVSLAVGGNLNVSDLVDTKNSIFLDDGLPDPRIAPYKTLFRELRSIIERGYNLRKINYGTTLYDSNLKGALVSHLSSSRAINLSESNILMTNGAQMSIYLVSKALINEGDIFIVGTPGYALAESSFTMLGACVIDVTVDEYGINVDQIAEICLTKKIKAVYVIPHHHYPTTVTLSPDRRLKLISLADTYNFIIIEDDYDYDFHYLSAPHLPMASYDHKGRIIYIGSISKNFSASLRLGYVVGTSDLINAIAYIRKHIDIRGDIMMEQAIAALFENGAIERHLRKSTKVYKERRDYMCKKLALLFDGQLSFQVPAGGMAIWINFNKEYDVHEIGSGLKEIGVSLNDNILFSDNKTMNHIRLGFSSLDFKEIDFLMKALQQVLKNLYTVVE